MITRIEKTVRIDERESTTIIEGEMEREEALKVLEFLFPDQTPGVEINVAEPITQK